MKVEFEILDHPSTLDPFVKEVLFFESKEKDVKHKLPFYADGFAGILFSKSENQFSISPNNKLLPEFYLFGQTIVPMSLLVHGTFEAYALRLYPFVIRTLLGVDSKILNDDCYDLRQVQNIDTQNTIDQLTAVQNKTEIIDILSAYFDELLKNAAKNPDYRVILATNLILKSNGSIKVSELRDRLHITERTLERQFLRETGVTPLQFAKIIQFHSTMKILSERDYINLTDIGYKTGYTDQSHFIRSFKKYTGKTPKEFHKQYAL